MARGNNGNFVNRGKQLSIVEFTVLTSYIESSLSFQHNVVFYIHSRYESSCQRAHFNGYPEDIVELYLNTILAKVNVRMIEDIYIQQSIGEAEYYRWCASVVWHGGQSWPCDWSSPDR